MCPPFIVRFHCKWRFLHLLWRARAYFSFSHNSVCFNMGSLAEYGNSTMPLSEVNSILSLMILLGTHFVVSSFTLVSDLDTTSAKTFQKMAAKYFLEINHQHFLQLKNTKVYDNLGYVVLGKSEAEISEVINLKAKLMVAVYRLRGNNKLPQFFSKLVYPPTIPFFLVLLFEHPMNVNSADNSHHVTAKCFRLYKPILNLPLRMFPVVSYQEPKWLWTAEEMNWNLFEKETRNMNGVTITIALATPLDKETSIARFWKDKNSFFWRSMGEHLRFRSEIYFQSLPPQRLKSATSTYLSLLKTAADGLGVLPVISPERDHVVEFILTGCDSKYHLMVKSPEYVHSWRFIFKPLSRKSWICTGITVLLISMTLRIVTYKQNFMNLSNCFLTIFGFVCHQGSTNIPRSCSTRLVYYTALVFSILMYQFYTSNFYSLLSTKKAKLPFTSLEHFMAKGTHSIYVHPDTAIYAYIVKAPNGTLKKLWDEFLSKDPSHQLKTSTRAKALSKVCRGKGAILGLPFQTIYFRELQCKLMPVNSGYFPTNIVTVVRKNFPFKPQFKFVHLRLLEAGLSHKFRDEFLNIEQQHATREGVTNEPVSFEHVAFLLGFHVAFIALSLLVLAVEVVASRVFSKGKCFDKINTVKICLK